jgi:signal transduction histidine kinase/tetratricopeptide (TPR) repeat protein/predicted Ser/Thr protein kinase
MTRFPQIPGIILDGELGRGAHSVVYRGTQHGVPCAVKLPNARARWTRWIYREAVSLARVKHPGLPAVLEVGELDGRPYLVMELVEGETLAEMLAVGPMDPAAAIDVARQLASILASVHDAGLVHRDVKPRNVVVELGGVLKLVDFGFATPMERVGATDTAGTAAYAAPEQLCPPGSVDGRADLFAVGRILFDALVGPSAKPRSTSDGPFGPEARAALIERGVDAKLAEIVSGLLRRDPAERYPSARALEAELERLAKGLDLLGPGGYEPQRVATPLVGRDREIERIVGACRGVRTSGELVLVRGPRGSGKTRLLEAVRSATSEFARTILSASRQDDPPLSTLRRIFESYFDKLFVPDSGCPVETLRAAIGNLGPVVRLVAPAVAARLGVAAPDERAAAASPREIASADAVAEGVAEVLLRVAKQVGPTVVTVDDAQWMDPVSTDALVRVAHRAVEAPIVIVLVSRSESASAHLERFSDVRRGRTIVIDLPRLSEPDVAALVAAHLGEPGVDPLLVSRIHGMAGGTPLGVLEVLGAFLDGGALRPHARTWKFDVEQTDSVVLPKGAMVLLGRRLGELAPATRRVLEAAAILGTSFHEAFLSRMLELSPEDLAYAFADARRAGLVEDGEHGHRRFVHDSLREMLVESLAEDARRRLHQRAAEALDAEKEPSFEELCAAALHFAAGQPEKDPARVYRVARAAAEAALARFDNETALRFHAQARRAAEAGRIALDPSFFRIAGEAHLRLGSLDESLAAFEAALDRTTDAGTKAVILGRIAWVYQTRAEPEQAWAILDRAFGALGAHMPVENLASAATTFAHLARSTLCRFIDQAPGPGRAHTDVLCALHYQNARLGLEYGKPARLIQSGVEAFELSKEGSARVHARARAYYGFVRIVLGRREAGAHEIEQAKAIAARQGDAATIAFCTQIHAVAAAWAGDIDQALVLLRECIDVHGPWLELNEYVGLVCSADTILCLRGQSTQAWPWIERAVERLRRSRVRPVVAEFLIHRARADLAAIGKGPDHDPWLAMQFELVPARDPGRGYHRLVSWGPRARFYVESGELGAEFEELVGAFEAEGHNPRSVHICVSEYYVAVAHARLHQALRARPEDRAARVAALRAAAANVRAAARVHLLKAHALLFEGALAWLEGREKKATSLLADAEVLANQHDCPWVLWGVARVRAHMLKASGKESAAKDQARVADLLARSHGAQTRARWVREEFGLTEPPTERRSHGPPSTRASSSSRVNRQLAALLQVARAPRRDLRAEQQAAAILDELVSSLHAERGAIWFQPEPGGAGTTVARHRGSEVSVSVDADSPRGELLRRVHESGTPWPTAPGLLEDGHGFDTERVLAVPLFLFDKPVGALCIERGPQDPPFVPEDQSLLVLLSHQVPIALEIARLLVEREQLQASLQQAKKMEAMGQLAGGLAHDFNNMLAAMKVSLCAAQERAASDEELMAELEIMSDAMQRAAQLTGQLLSFSRHQPVPVAVHDINQLIVDLEPMLRRVAGPKIEVVVQPSPGAFAAEVDQNGFDQALVNLLMNARDAMPNGGTFTIATRNVVLDETAAQHANVAPGEYVEVEVSDTGEGMNSETLSRIFEPFFTTKGAGRGTGLGLAMVYAFARNCGGSITVFSEVGRGTQFRIYLRRADGTRASRPVRQPPPPPISSVTLSPRGKAASERPKRPTPVPRANGEAGDGRPQPNGNGTLHANANGSGIEHANGSGQRPSSNDSAPSEETIPDTILVVDDDDLVRKSISKILERHGYRVVAASGSSEALDVARTQGRRIALVILDVLMPGLTGPELGRRLSHLNLAAKMLFVSGYSPESISVEDVNVAADMLLQKPFSQAVLLERVRRLMPS